MADHGWPQILVVEDDPTLLQLVVRMLTFGGFSTLATSRAAEGLEIVRKHRADIALAIIDIVMPGMSGLDLATDLNREYPDLTILYTSGYIDSVAADVLSRRTPDHVLLKPFSEPVLLDRVNLLLGTQAQRKPAQSSVVAAPEIRTGKLG